MQSLLVQVQKVQDGIAPPKQSSRQKEQVVHTWCMDTDTC
jgi:hypothetical protein